MLGCAPPVPVGTAPELLPLVALVPVVALAPVAPEPGVGVIDCDSALVAEVDPVGSVEGVGVDEL
jgi:hypothetical protein